MINNFLKNINLSSFYSSGVKDARDVVLTPIKQESRNITPKEDCIRVDGTSVLAQLYGDKSDREIFLVKPKVFPGHERGSLNIYDKYPEQEFYPYYDYAEARFTPEANAKDIPFRVPEEQVIDVSNFDYPSGTIAGSTTLDKTLYTDRLLQCAALTVVDRKNNTQSLVHVYPGYSIDCNKQIIQHVLKYSEPQNLEVSIIPGRMSSTAGTVQFLLDTLQEYSPQLDVKLYNFPENDVNICDRGLLLQNGNLTCCDMHTVTNKIVNPKENITYAEPVKFANANDSDLISELQKTEFASKYDIDDLTKWARDNKLDINHFWGVVDFLDDDGKVVRCVKADYPDATLVKRDERFFYNADGSLKGKMSKDDNGRICYYTFDEFNFPCREGILAEDKSWYITRFGQPQKLPNNPITGQSQI